MWSLETIALEENVIIIKTHIRTLSLDLYILYIFIRE
jgi:hypothetical protein